MQSDEEFIPRDESVPRAELPVSIRTRKGKEELVRRFHNLKGHIKYKCGPLNEMDQRCDHLIGSFKLCQFELVSKSPGSSKLTPIDDILVDLQKWQTQWQKVIQELEGFIDQEVMPWQSKSPDFVEFLAKGRELPKDVDDADSTPQRFSWIHTAYSILMSDLSDIYWRAFDKREDLGSTVAEELKRWEDLVRFWFKPVIDTVIRGR
ncbi:hypothetical protein SLS58_008597 [Diplodia intermedia]|uniref:Uncharacterized protein n=1 Tax=Diplodia intermedia TaxID=856260 RepID=A0ABR3TGV5_9PEZI